MFFNRRLSCSTFSCRPSRAGAWISRAALGRTEARSAPERAPPLKAPPPAARSPAPVAGRAGTTRPANTSGQAVADAAGADVMAALGLTSLLGRVPATAWRAASKAPGPGAEVAGRVAKAQARRETRPAGRRCAAVSGASGAAEPPCSADSCAGGSFPPGLRWNPSGTVTGPAGRSTGHQGGRKFRVLEGAPRASAHAQCGNAGPMAVRRSFTKGIYIGRDLWQLAVQNMGEH